MFIYPTLYSFSYDLRRGLRQGKSAVDENKEAFKRKLSRLPTELRQQINLLEESAEVVELLHDKIYRFDEVNHTGFYYPVRLHDTYGLLVDYSCREAQSLEHFQWAQDLKEGIWKALNNETANLGQSWVLFASVPNVPLENYETIAQQCYKALFPQGDWDEDQTEVSNFSGGQWFELEKEQETGEMAHVVIMLFSNEQMRENHAPRFMENELRRLLYYHKITRAYLQSQAIKEKLRENSVEIGNILDDFSKKNKTADISGILKKANTIFRGYVELFNNLAVQIPIIETNRLNYQRWSHKLAQNFSGLTVPTEFERCTTDKYLTQIQRDQATFGLQLELIKNMVASVQAEGTYDNVRQNLKMQGRLELLEILFASYYGVALVHYISESHYGLALAGAGVIGALVAALLLKPWKHHH